MLNYSKYNLDDRCTIISLLTKGLPKNPYTKSFNKDNLVETQTIKLSADASNSKNPVKEANALITPDNDDDVDDSHPTYSADQIFAPNGISHVMVTYAKTLLYAMAEQCNSFSNPVVDYDHKYYNGIFIQNTSNMVVTNPKYIYYIKHTLDKSSGEYQLTFLIYPNKRSIKDAIWINELYQIKDVPLGNPDKAINALKSLWITQSTKYHIDKQAKPTKLHRATLPPDFLRIFSELLINITSGNKYTAPISCTYADMVKFYHEVRNGKLTKATRNVQEWLFSQSSRMSKGTRAQQILKILRLRPNFKSVVNGIKEIPKSRISKLRKDFKQDTVYKTEGFHLAHVYQMNYPQHQTPGKKHITLVHGTNSYSIPTIIFDGLKTHNELVSAKAKNFDDTGQSLGDGVYMADPRQFTKSLNYSNHYDSKYKFLIITDVAYNKPIKVNGYIGTPNKPYDMIFADSVGFAHGYDEYVARHGSQIRIKYILAFQKNKKKKNN